MTDTLKSQLARYEAVKNAPQHKEHIVAGMRVDTWFDAETKSYIAWIPEHLTCAQTEENALKAARSVLKFYAEWTLKNMANYPSAPEQP